MNTFFLTKLAAALSSVGERSTTDGFLLVETNFRIYAYVRNELDIALLSLFSQILYRLPNMAVAMITRMSANIAFAHGITTDLILEFIEHHAHPEMVAKIGSRGPPTIADQLSLWEAERHRVKYNPGILMEGKDFPSAHVFAQVREFAEDCGVSLFSDPLARILVVDESGFETVQAYIQKLVSR